MPIVPLATLGIVGGGQLGRMTALAARSAGYRLHALDPDPDCPVKPIVEKCITAPWDDAAAAIELARGCDVVTFEIEKASVAALREAAKITPVRPSPDTLYLVQNRLRQKRWLREQGFPVTSFAAVHSVAELATGLGTLGPSFVKVAEGGYDGRGQIRVQDASEAHKAWEYLGGFESVAEAAVDLDYEISVLVARNPSGEVAVYPPAWNHHERQILVWSVMPAPVPNEVAREAQAVARKLALALHLEGILVVEMFVTKSGQVLVNELAPRPHNSYHASERACVTGQFEQLVRAICDLPLGSVKVVRPGAIVNLLGDLWMGPAAPDFAAALRIPESRLHLYGKTARPQRKMGHISATGATVQEAVERVLAARAALTSATESVDFSQAACATALSALSRISQ